MLTIATIPAEARVCCVFINEGSSATQLIFEWRDNNVCEGGREKFPYNSYCKGLMST